MEKDIFRKFGAKSIWQDTKEMNNRYVRFQTTFNANKGDRVLFHIAADTNYELYINGTIASFDQYHDFPKYKKYDSVEIGACLKDGENLVSVLAYSQGIESGQHLPGLPMVIFAAEKDGKCILISDENTKCASAGEFKQGEMPKIHQARAYTYEIDLRKDDGWRASKVCDDWSNAVSVDNSDIQFAPRPIPMIELKEHCQGDIVAYGGFDIGEGETVSEKMQYAALSFDDANNVYKEENGACRILKDNAYLIFDIKEETAGYMTVDVQAEDGACLDIAIGEHLVDLRVRSYVSKYNFGYRTICRQGRQKHTFYIGRNAGRYIQVFAHKGIAKIYEAAMIKAEYPMDFCGELDTGDRLFNKIFKVAQRTCRLCMHEHFEDCPEREQSLFGGDGRITMLACYYGFGETVMPKDSLRLLAQGQRENGLLEINAPSYFEKTIPTFCLAWVIAVREYILFSGDIEFGKEMIGKIKKLMRYFTINKEYSLINRPGEKCVWNFFEWSEGFTVWDDDGTMPVDAPTNAFYMMALKSERQIALWIGDEEELAWIDERMQIIKSGFHKTFYAEEKGGYKSYINRENHFAQLTQAWALLGDCVPEEYKATIRKACTREDFNRVSLGLTAYKYDALIEDSEAYGEYILNDIEELWGKMLYNGATSFWETIDGSEDFARAASLCHGWSSAPMYFLWKYMAGVYPQEPGFKTIKPKALNENIRLKGKIKTPHGIFEITVNGGNTAVKAV